MSLNKFISRHKSKLESKAKRQITLPGDHLYGFFTEPEDMLALARPDSLHEKKQEQKVKEAKQRISKRFLGAFTDEDVLYALRLPFASGNIEKALRLLTMVHEANDYHVKSLDGRVKEVGAINRSGISCYLDSVLFAMFAQLDSFDIMLDKKFDDPKKNHLAALLRLWVNAERSGELITTDITEEIQNALAKCGWKDAGEKRQQDALEAFSFILEQLGFPDLHLKMDIFHSGKEDKNDDHKIIRERVLTMPLPDPREDGPSIKLEDCFELALTARVDVKRRYEEERRATITSVRSQRSIEFKKTGAVHVEAVEVSGSEPQTPATETVQRPPIPSTGSTQPSEDSLPSYQSHNFIQERYVDSKDEKDLEAGLADSTGTIMPLRRRRASTLRKEVSMPAWQMYSLIPFHTDEEPKSDEEVIEHLRQNRPTFCIALKRYSFGKDGQAVRRDDRVDIPLDMALPYFIYDNSSQDNNSLFQNFKISLQALVCHRGKHVEAGHYVSLVRPHESRGGGKWLLHDDLAEHRVCEVDIAEALKEEMPYLLFYRVEPITDMLSPRITSKPPSLHSEAKDSGIAGLSPSLASDTDGASERYPSLVRRSSGLTAESDHARGRTSTSRERPVSIAFTDASNGSEIPASAESPTGRATAVLGKSSRLGSKRRGESRTSRDSEKRNSSSLNRLSGLFSKQDVDAAALMPATNAVPAAAAASIPSPVPEHKSTDQTKKLGKERDKGRSKSRKTSRGRLSNSKRGDGRPDRECRVM